ncbi:MAG: hypothetical protein ABIA97_02110 [Candidatus Omnitrophota bacterium]
MEVVRILLVLAIFIAIINLGSYLRRLNETMDEVRDLLKEKK